MKLLTNDINILKSIKVWKNDMSNINIFKRKKSENIDMKVWIYNTNYKNNLNYKNILGSLLE